MNSTRRPLARSTVGLLLLALVGTSACKKKVPPPPPAERVPVQKVESKLQITTVSPSSVDADTPSAAKIYGSAFATGVAVKIGDASVDSVSMIDPNTLDIQIPAMQPGSYDVQVSLPDGTSAILRRGITVRGAATTGGDCSHRVLYFGFDSAGLSADAKRTLSDAASCYQGLRGQIRVAGHADERGTTDYNLALGQRRAESVKTYVAGLGVSGSKIKTVSYGEERPSVRGSNEAAWAKNRRAEVSAE